MYLAQTIRVNDESFAMVGALPLHIEHGARPAGHGYTSGEVDGDNPFLACGLALRGHEFHYSRIQTPTPDCRTVVALSRGTGVGRARDGLCSKRVVATYGHLHALGVPDWAPGLVAAAQGKPVTTPSRCTPCL
jgi:cobyrinic acid a,c-diamide synthase